MSVARYPAVKFTGMQPQGLNASSEGEMRAFYDTVNAFQNFFLRPHLTTVIDMAQITLWGAIDPDIVFEFVPLWEPTAKEDADLKKADADRDTGYIDSGVISPEEVRRKLASDPKSGYDDIDPSDVPEPPEPEPPPGGEGGDPFGGGEQEQPDSLFAGDSMPAFDDWDEGDHPRGQPKNAGQFGSGGGGGGSSGGKGAKVGGGSKGAPAGSGKQSLRMPQFGLTPTPKEPHQHEEDDPDGSAYFKKNWHKSNSVGGHSQPTAKQVKTYTDAWNSTAKPLDPSKLKRVGEQMGSNPGGVFETPSGEKFYVKKGKSPEHVKNELLAASLYQLAGAQTLNYRPIAGGNHIATGMEKLSAKNVSQLTPEQRKQAQADFVTHAWLGNWDAAGLGGDNIGAVNGVPTSLDLGGALEYRAQGAPKGGAFGSKVGEIDTLRDPKMNPDSAGLFGDMHHTALKASAKRVTSIPDEKIIDTVQSAGLPSSLAAKLIARKQDIAKRFAGGTAQDGALAEDEFNESDHPRDPDGKFASGSGGGGGGGKAKALTIAQHVAQKGGDVQELLKTLTNAEWDEVKDLYGNAANLLAAGTKLNKSEKSDLSPAPQGNVEGAAKSKKSAFGGLWKDPAPGESESINFNKNVARVLAKATNAGQSYRQMLAFMVKNLGKHGALGADNPYFAPLTKKLGEAWGMAYKKAVATNNQKDITAIQAKLKQLGIMTTQMAPPAPSSAPAWKKADEQFQTAMAEVKANNPPAVAEKKAGFLSGIKEAVLGKPAPPPPAPPPKAPQATPEELKKAAKATTFPESPSNASAANGLIKKFNEKYANKTVTDPAALNQKVADFKQMQSQVQAINTAHASEQATKQKVANEAAATKLKAEKQAAAEKNKQYMKDLGISETEAMGFNALVDMIGVGKSSELVKQFQVYQSDAANLGYPISGFQYALIRNYINGGYSSINAALRAPSMTQAQALYARMVNNALDKLPKYEGLVERGTHLEPSQIAAYQPGHVVPHRAFTSTGIGYKFGGNVHYKIKAIGKRGADFSKGANQHEKEVLFKANTNFLVHKVTKSGNTTIIEMEELENND